MVGHRRSSCEKEKKGTSHKDDQLEYKSIRSQPDDAYDDLPSYKEAVQDDKNIPDDWVKVGYSDTGRATQRHADREQPPCSHWSESMCRITVKSRKCCSCMDERPGTNSGLYPMYVDGQGWVEKATRWQYYCPNCQEYFDPDAKARSMRDQHAWAEKHAKSLADERDQRYFGLGRWIDAVKGSFSS